MDPLVLSFWMFNFALCLSFTGSMVRRAVELRLYRKWPEIIRPKIKAGKVPVQARVQMYLFKVPSYILFIYSMILVLNHENRELKLFATYGATTLLMLRTPFEVSPKADWTAASNLQTLADRLEWLRWTAVLAPLAALLIDSLDSRKLSILSWLPTLLVLSFEYFIFHASMKKSWKELGIDFEKGEDNSSTPSTSQGSF